MTTPELKTFAAILQNSGLFGILKQPGSFTLFAPNNDAFNNIKDRLPKLMANQQELTDVMINHLLPIKIKKLDINRGRFPVQTVEGKTIWITKSFMKITINDKAVLIKTDIAAANGVIHIIDDVIIGKISLVFQSNFSIE